MSALNAMALAVAASALAGCCDATTKTPTTVITSAPPSASLAQGPASATGARAAVAPPSPSATPPPNPGASLSAQPGAVARKVRLHYPVLGDGTCVSHRWVHSALRAGVEPLTSTMHALLAGPTAAERGLGFRSPFGPRSNGGTQAPAPPMAQTFRAVRLTGNGLAIVSFDGAAMGQLNFTACVQSAIKSSIERTLTQFQEVRVVAYEVDGIIVTDWDG